MAAATETETETEKQHSFDDDNDGSSEEARVCARSLTRIPGIEMMENGKKNDFATK